VTGNDPEVNAGTPISSRALQLGAFCHFSQKVAYFLCSGTSFPSFKKIIFFQNKPTNQQKNRAKPQFSLKNMQPLVRLLSRMFLLLL
jgi:hypothetical protein